MKQITEIEEFGVSFSREFLIFDFFKINFSKHANVIYVSIDNSPINFFRKIQRTFLCNGT